MVKEFSDVFCDKPPVLRDRKRPADAPYHRIWLKDPWKTINGRIFTLSEKYMNYMIEFLEYHLQSWTYPTFEKLDLGGNLDGSEERDSSGTPRYRAFNDNTVKDHTLLSRHQILRRIARAKIRGYIDCPDAYYQMQVHSDDIWKTAFKTPFGMFEWLVMPQGLCNAPPTRQRYMNWILREYVGTSTSKIS